MTTAHLAHCDLVLYHEMPVRIYDYKIIMTLFMFRNRAMTTAHLAHCDLVRYAQAVVKRMRERHSWVQTYASESLGIASCTSYVYFTQVLACRKYVICG
jgi:hypothetical protein